MNQVLFATRGAMLAMGGKWMDHCVSFERNVSFLTYRWLDGHHAKMAL